MSEKNNEQKLNEAEEIKESFLDKAKETAGHFWTKAKPVAKALGIGILAGAAILGVGAVVMDKFGNPLTESNEEEPETDDVPFDESSETEAA